MDLGAPKYSAYLILVGVSMVALFATLDYFNPGRSRTESNSRFEIRVTDQPVFYMQHRYSFETRLAGESNWRLIRSHVQDDPFEIDDSPIGFPTEEIGYFALGNIFAVTKDRGQSWHFFDYTKDSDWGRLNGYTAIITSAVVDKDGNGEMKLKHFREGEVARFISSDFGVTWKDAASRE
ncbi:MAG: hypothetical protein IPM63_17770 [Acidobacteriota bacterium]|nr:MAG: hypothetical protein IPM63_17770 [Acidobacteriota bacterium]